MDALVKFFLKTYDSAILNRVVDPEEILDAFVDVGYQ